MVFHKMVASVVVSLCASSNVCRAEQRETGVRIAQYQRQNADRASGIQGLLSPGSPVPRIGPRATEMDYVGWAKTELSQGQDAEAELSLEWAQLRSRLDEDEAAYRANNPPPPYDSLCRRSLCKALQAIGRGQFNDGKSFINAAIDELDKTAAIASPIPAFGLAAR